MRSLFLKLFLWFWLSQLLMLAAFAVAQRQWADSPSPPGPAAMRALARDAAELLERGETTLLRAWLGELNAGPLRFYLLDAQGRELGGRRLPREFARSLLERPDAFRRHRSSAQLQADGAQFLLVASRPPRGRLGELPPWARPAIAAAVSALVGLLLAAWLSRPIRRVRRAAQALAAGALDTRVAPSRGRDELAELGRDFNAMAERLQSLLDARSELLRDVSHELRSPLARLQVALELARRRAGEKAGSALDRIELEAERLNELISQMLALTRMETAAEPPPLGALDLTALCREIAEDALFEAAREDKRVELLAAPAVNVRGDPALLRSAIENVVRNALRHTPAGSAVELALIKDGGMATVVVRDYGPGLPESELERVFDPFVRISAARERDTGGYGLGLTIAHRIMLRHGGDIRAINAEGGGLKVRLRLPLATENSNP